MIPPKFEAKSLPTIFLPPKSLQSSAPCSCPSLAFFDDELLPFLAFNVHTSAIAELLIPLVGLLSEPLFGSISILSRCCLLDAPRYTNPLIDTNRPNMTFGIVWLRLCHYHSPKGRKWCNSIQRSFWLPNLQKFRSVLAICYTSLLTFAIRLEACRPWPPNDRRSTFVSALFDCPSSAPVPCWLPSMSLFVGFQCAYLCHLPELLSPLIGLLMEPFLALSFDSLPLLPCWISLRWAYLIDINRPNMTFSSIWLRLCHYLGTQGRKSLMPIQRPFWLPNEPMSHPPSLSAIIANWYTQSAP